jgi:3-oxoacyl-[acyl-carrier protein] reductase
MAEKIRTILVTGATGGIGRAVCERLATTGARVVLSARDPVRLAEFCEDLRFRTGHDHAAFAADMTDDVSVARFAEKLSGDAIELDGAVLMPPQPHATGDSMPGNDAWRELFQGSFIGPLALLGAALERMKPDPTNGHRCKVVIISGISSAQVLSHYATSNVLRCAWLAQAKTLAFVLGERGIHVNTLSLGGTLSDWYKAGIERRAKNASMTYDERIAEETSNVPLRKYGTPAEVAIAVEGLLSPFSDHMTGLNILHDGGFTRAY